VLSSRGSLLSLISSARWSTTAANSLGLRRVLLPLFRTFNLGDITLRHPWTGDRMLVHSFRHKGYWFLGRKREFETMTAFQRLLKSGDVVIDVGAHIGYTAVFFARLVGPAGHIYAFEPGPNNLPYTRRNCSNCQFKNISLIEMAASDSDGCAPLYIETLTGQNNSLLCDYPSVSAVARTHGSRPETAPATVRTIQLDSYLEQYDLRPALIKIDVEGAEAEVLNGALKTLARIRPILMVEVTQRHSVVTNILLEHNYRLFTPAGAPIDVSEHPGDDPVSGNVFAFPAENRDSRLNEA